MTNQQLPLKMLCSSKFGRYPKISREQVFNLFESDGWMVNYAGYEAVKTILDGGVGRGIFFSSRNNSLYVVMSQNVYEVVFEYGNIIPTQIGSIETLTGDVFIDENIQSQVAICDKQDLYIYDYGSKVFIKLNTGFSVGYVSFQDNRFITAVNGQPQWRLSDNTLLSITTASVSYGGADYHVGDILTLLNGKNNAQVKVDTIDSPSTGVITGISIVAGKNGSGYNDAIYDVSGGNGTGAKIAVTVDKVGFTGTVAQTGTFQTKPDNVVACVSMPSKNGQLLIMGSTVTEIWSDLGLKKFPYQRSSGYNIDYGCINPSTIATNDDFVVWLGSNEHSGLAIMYCSGGEVHQISTDGINYRLENLHNPKNSYAFIFRQDGHIFYQLTFPDPLDNVTYTYDFNTKKFFTLCDSRHNCHIAKYVSFFNNDYYFISFNDGKLYQIDTNFTTYDGDEIPRIIVTSPSCLPDRKPFVINSITFPIEQGSDQRISSPITVQENIVDNQSNYMPDDANEYIALKDADGNITYNILPSMRVDLCTSSDGAATFGNPVGIYLNTIGKRRNIFKYYNLGRYNEVTFQFRFWGLGRFVLTDGVAEVAQ